MTLFQPEFGLIFWMLVVFLILLGILAKYAWPVIIRTIEQRTEFIDKGVDFTRQAKQQLEETKEEIRQMIAQTHKQQLETLQETENIKKKMIEEAKKEAAAEAQKLMKEAKIAIERTKMEAQTQIRQQVSTLALEIAEKLLRKELAGDTQQIELIDNLLDEVESKK